MTLHVSSEKSCQPDVLYMYIIIIVILTSSVYSFVIESFFRSQPVRTKFILSVTSSQCKIFVNFD